MDIRDMKPGKELDALIGERVMGIKAYHHRYSSEISAAWEVVEKMKTCGLLVDICQVWDGYSVTFDDGSDFAKEYRHKAETAPHAICLAALLAMEDKA